MRKLLLIVLLITQSIISHTQTCTTLVAYDRLETYNWLGDWWLFQSNSGFYTNASTSPSVSVAIYGIGNGSSGIEQNWYVLPNISGLNPTSTYEFKFRLGSYRFTSTATTRGVDVDDFVDVQLSTDGGFTYVSEIRITGRSNAFWDYNTNGVINKTSNGTLTTYSPAAGGNRTTTGDGYSVITLTIPSGITQIAFDILARVNSAGEEWWMDDFELYEIFDCNPLPITLIEFNGNNQFYYNKLYWSTASEQYNDYFTLERSINGQDWEVVSKINGSGNSNTLRSYEYKDYTYIKNYVNYYRLSQTDFDGTKEYFNIISIQDESCKKCCQETEYEYFTLMGSVIIDFNQASTGFYLRKCGNNVVEKIFKP